MLTLVTQSRINERDLSNIAYVITSWKRIFFKFSKISWKKLTFRIIIQKLTFPIITLFWFLCLLHMYLLLGSVLALNTDVQCLILTFSQNLNVQEPWKWQKGSSTVFSSICKWTAGTVLWAVLNNFPKVHVG